MSGKIYLSYHKPFPLLDKDFLVPVHAGRQGSYLTKDGILSEEDAAFLRKLPGDDTGIHISEKNREYSECTVLYWIWKNTEYQKDSFIGLNQYRRQFILNDFFDNAESNREKLVYQCVHLCASEEDVCDTIGLTEEAVETLMKDYDVILPHTVDLTSMDTMNFYEDWGDNIPGVHITDLMALEQFYGEKYPEEASVFSDYLMGGKKLMYQMFVAKPEVFSDYCEWLFPILFELEKKLDVSLYTPNGKRTMGYLAEVLYGYYFTKREANRQLRVKTCGVTFLEVGEQTDDSQ